MSNAESLLQIRTNLQKHEPHQSKQSKLAIKALAWPLTAMQVSTKWEISNSPSSPPGVAKLPFCKGQLRVKQQERGKIKQNSLDRHIPTQMKGPLKIGNFDAWEAVPRTQLL